MKVYLNYISIFLFGIFVPLNLYATNIGEVYFSQFLHVICFVFTINILALVIIRIVNIDLIFRIIPIICISWLIFFLYFPIYYPLTLSFNLRQVYFIIFIILLYSVLLVLFLKVGFTTILNLNKMFFILIFVPLYNIIDKYYEKINSSYKINNKLLQIDQITDSINYKPDIYYIRFLFGTRSIKYVF